MTTTDWIQFWLAIGTVVLASISIAAMVVTVVQNNKINFETSRAQIIFYIDYDMSTSHYYLVLKNFGKSIGKLTKIIVTPNLDWNKTLFKQDLKPMTEVSNVLLAPNQKISSWFDFDEYPDQIFEVYLEYETLGKTQTESYTIDLSYTQNLDWLNSYAIDDHTQDNKSILYKINNSIKDLSDKFR